MQQRCGGDNREKRYAETGGRFSRKACFTIPAILVFPTWGALFAAFRMVDCCLALLYTEQHAMIPNNPTGTMRIPIALVAGILAVSACQSPPVEGPGTDTDPFYDRASEREAIRDVLMRQQEAWNAGDLEAFMDDYIREDTLRFTSGAQVRYGWDSAMERYLTTYPDRSAMGNLTFDDLAIDVLSNEWALVFGAWHLKRSGEYDDIGGRYTLLMHRGAQGWKVVYDHTSQ